MPAVCIVNGMHVSTVPPEIAQLNDYENILIQRSKAFQVVVTMNPVANKRLPSRQMVKKQIVEEVPQLPPRMLDKAIQKHICKSFRSKANQTKVNLVNKMTSPLKPCLHSVSTSPFKIKHDVNSNPSRPSINVLSKIIKQIERSDSDTSYTPSDEPSSSTKSLQMESTSDCSEMLEDDKRRDDLNALECTLKKIKKSPRSYIGIPLNCYYLVNLIQEQTGQTSEGMIGIWIPGANGYITPNVNNIQNTSENTSIKEITALNKGVAIFMLSYLAEAGIVHQKTNTDTPEQNAISECMNRILVKRARFRLNQVLRAPDKNNWITAMEEELQAFKENDAWAVVSEVPQGKTLVQLADRDIVQLLAALEDGNISEDGLEDESEDKETFYTNAREIIRELEDENAEDHEDPAYSDPPLVQAFLGPSSQIIT
ncbi:hypothetical protein EVAR_78267_1 [Eumeta japonica]|uniref:DUF6570 domain-containing protein n=1 Tax=Eumeta variegata TaxID=151549 RepID=A0A4C1T6J0_EUMVA|nr:hypothetical protein EVAR_78267_1 [Eumeta japonica]